MIYLGLLAATFYRAEKFRRRRKIDSPKVAAQVWYLELGLIGFLIAGFFGQLEKAASLYIYLALLWAVTEAWPEPRRSRQVRRRAVAPRPTFSPHHATRLGN